MELKQNTPNTKSLLNQKEHLEKTLEEERRRFERERQVQTMKMKELSHSVTNVRN